MILLTKRVTKKYADVWDEVKNQIKFNSDDGLLLNKPLKFHA